MSEAYWPGLDSNVVVVLCRRAQQGGAADVDVFDSVGKTRAWPGDGGFEGIEVHDDKIDGGEALRLERLKVIGHISPRQDSGVNLGMERFDPATEDFGLAGKIGHFCDLDTGVQQGRARAAACEQLCRALSKHTGELDQSRFVVDTE
jgi:hypothetical protein